MLKDKLKEINENIDFSCSRSKRDIKDISLLAVSKTRTAEEVKDAYDLGLREFGENKVQEMVAKYEDLPKDIKWHMIGHLQTNKVKYIAEFVTSIHSLDSLRLAETIHKEAKKHDRVIPVLLEINVAGEESKFGIKFSEIYSFLESIKHLDNIVVTGLMAIAPNPTNGEENRMYFKALYKVFVDIQREKRDNVNMNVLSMGMSKDYMIAIEEGSTTIRIGSDLFGDRL